MPFPNIPMSQTRPFASPSSIANGEFGVGVNGFFLQNSLPPHKLLASGSFTVSITNNSDSSITIPLIHFLIPAPTIQFFGVGDSTFPQGADPARDATATAVIDIVETLTLANGTKLETILVDYGLQVLRALPSTVLFPFPRRDGVGQVTRFEEPDGSFGFLLPELEGQFAVQLPAGASVEYGTHYTAEVSTGFGETGVFAAIGDPFNLSTGGGRFDIQVGDPLPPSSVPEPATAILLGAGLAIAGLIRRRRAWHVA